MFVVLLAFPSVWANETYVNDACQFYDENFKIIGEVKEHRFCRRLHDHHYLVVEPDRYLKRVEIRKFSVEKTFWKAKVQAHHDLTFSPSREKAAVLGSEFSVYNGKRTRFDTIHIFDTQSGEELGKWSSFEELKDLRKRLGDSLKPMVKKTDYGRNYYEIFHFNSVSFLDENRLVVSLGRHRKIGLFETEGDIKLESLYMVPGEGMSHAARPIGQKIYVYSNLLNLKEKLSGVAVFDLEKRRFQKASFLPGLRFYSPTRGNIDLSKNKDRMLISNSDGRVFELEIKSRKLLHDIQLNHKKDGYPDADFYQLYYFR